MIFFFIIYYSWHHQHLLDTFLTGLVHAAQKNPRTQRNEGLSEKSCSFQYNLSEGKTLLEDFLMEMTRRSSDSLVLLTLSQGSLETVYSTSYYSSYELLQSHWALPGAITKLVVSPQMSEPEKRMINGKVTT